MHLKCSKKILKNESMCRTFSTCHFRDPKRFLTKSRSHQTSAHLAKSHHSSIVAIALKKQRHNRDGNKLQEMESQTEDEH